MDGETKEEAQLRQATCEQRRKEHEEEQKRRAAQRQAAAEKEQQKYEAEQKRRDKQYQARRATLERIVQQAPAAFDGFATPFDCGALSQHGHL